MLREFDLDGALARRPALILVDELAHSNAPGCRHPKRWQDVEELLDAGIDVLTTVNVQHLESLNDVVGGITGIRVWETVTDRVFDQADEVVLVDFPPDELLQRLKEGKVYLPDQAERAIQNFFRKGNLIALRELALRRIADRVDDEMQSYQQRDGSIPPPLSARRCWSVSAPAPVRMRWCAPPAGWPTSWTASGTPCTWKRRRCNACRKPAAGRFSHTLKLAQDLGAHTATQATDDIAQAIVEYARRHGLGRVVVGRGRPGRWRWLRRALAGRLARLAPDLDLLALAWDDVPQRSLSPTAEVGDEDRTVLPFAARRYGATLLVCLGTALAAIPLRPHFDLANIIMLFLLAVVGVAVRYGRGPAVLAAIVNVAAFDVFFVQPHFSLAIHDWQYLLTFAVMLIVGLIVGQLTARFRYQAQVATAREERARHLYEMSRELSGALAVEQVIEISERCVEASFRVKARLLLPDDEDRLQPPPVRPGQAESGFGHRPMVFRSQRSGWPRYRYPARRVAVVPAAQGSVAHPRSAGRGARAAAVAADPGTAAAAGYFCRADRHRPGAGAFRHGRPRHAGEDGSRTAAQFAAGGALPRPAHAADRADRAGGNAGAGVGRRAVPPPGITDGDPRAGSANGAAGRQPAGHGQVAGRRRPVAQGLAVAGGTVRLGHAAAGTTVARASAAAGARPGTAAGQLRRGADRAGAGEPAGERHQVYAGRYRDRHHRQRRIPTG